MRIILRPEHDADTLLIRSFSPEMDKAVREAHSRKGMIVAVTDQENAKILEKIRGAIGWMSLAQLVSEKRSLIPLPLDNIRPSQENLVSCRYPYCKHLFVVTRTKPTPIAKSFIEFLTSAEGREILLKTGHVVEVKKP